MLWGSQEIEGKTKKPGHGKGRDRDIWAAGSRDRRSFRDIHLKNELGDDLTPNNIPKRESSCPGLNAGREGLLIAKPMTMEGNEGGVAALVILAFSIRSTLLDGTDALASSRFSFSHRGSFFPSHSLAPSPGLLCSLT